MNHIDPHLSPEKLNEIKELYKYYHKRFWCYKRVFKHYKESKLLANLTSTALVVAGTLAGGISLNPIVLGVIRGAGLLLNKQPMKLKIIKIKFK